jgi:SWI/SNF-related matrix-associated actin-dependent regulator of chromatin subfamily A3
MLPCTVAENVPKYADDFLRYTHKITGLQYPSADDMFGGILADDMGLGKSLSMIATIVATLLNAKQFAEARSQTCLTVDTSKIRVKSTLIVVPSARTYLRLCHLLSML